ncbi:hypothetical protein OAU50_03395 [Planctomycetota bacterium]|nr:hypothetical protein [Planctomycetota bacterium]
MGKADQLGNAAGQVARANDMRVARDVVKRAIAGRRSLEADADKIVTIADQGDIRRDMLRLDEIDGNDAGSFIDFSMEESRIYPWWSGSASRGQDANTLHIWTKMALVVNSDIQRATLDQLRTEGTFVIHYGDKRQDDIRVPLHLVLNKYGKGQFVSDSQAAGKVEADVEPGFTKRFFNFEPNRPLVVVPSDTKVYCHIEGLKGVIAGNAPVFKFQPFFTGLTAEK